MPGDDLLRFIGGPLAPSVWWVVLAALIVVAFIAWCAGVVIWTLPPQRLRTIPVIRDWHAKLVRRHFLHAIEDISAQFNQRSLSGQDTATAYNHTVRSFMFVRTGVYAKNLLTDDLDQSELSEAVTLLTRMHDAQFNPESRADVAALGRSAEELIHEWT